MRTLRTFAFRATYGLALALGGAASFLPSAALAASGLFGLVEDSSGDVVFGTIDSTSGLFTQIGGATGGPPGPYAPVFDPAANAFFATIAPLGTLNTNLIDKIDSATGAVTGVVVHPASSDELLVDGLGVNTTTGQLFGLVEDSSGDVVFGTIDSTSGLFTQIGGATGGPPGPYAPVFDPAANAFFATIAPLGTLNTNLIDKIDSATGAVTGVVVHPASSDELLVDGLGVASNPTAAVPEPSTRTMMLVGFAGLGYGAFRRSRRPRLDRVAA